MTKSWTLKYEDGKNSNHNRDLEGRRGNMNEEIGRLLRNVILKIMADPKIMAGYDISYRELIDRLRREKNENRLCS